MNAAALSRAVLDDFRVGLQEVSGYEKLEQQQELYRKNVALLRSTYRGRSLDRPLLGSIQENISAVCFQCRAADGVRTHS